MHRFDKRLNIYKDKLILHSIMALEINPYPASEDDANTVSDCSCEELDEMPGLVDEEEYAEEPEEDGDDVEGDEDEDEEEDEDYIIRAKWQMDGAATLDEAIEKLRDFIEYLDVLKKDGWELRQPVEDDYGYIYKRQ